MNAQSNYFYYYKGQKIYLTLDKTKLSIITNSQFEKNSISNLNIKNFNLNSSENLKYSEIEFLTEPTDLEFYQKFNSLKSNPYINHVNLFFKRGDNIPSIGISNIFYIKLKSSADYLILQERANAKGAIIEKQIPFMPLWYQLKLNPNSIENTLTLTSQFWETGLFEDIDPGFLFNFNNDQNHQNNTSNSSTPTTCSNDTNFSSLWGLDNATNPNIDINACQAWNVSQGNGIKVAVVDGSGIELTHNDLAANIYPLSFNMEIGSSPSQVTPDEPHSTHIAGTIAAIKDNNLQVVGVAPQSKIMSISHSGLLFPSMAASQYASGISWAWQNGADVINCSWGDQNGLYYSTFHSTILENAILNAMSLGRNGKGSVVVFASGNWGGIDYPGSFHPDIITVGAINQNGQRAFFPPNQQSAYGDKLDVVAPGFQIRSTTLNNTISFLNGTSMAAPHVAGIAALILSVNPCLTQQQVATIIETTSQKVGGYAYTTIGNRPNGTWQDEVGYGLVDAYASVLMAQSMGSATLDLMIKDSQDDTGAEPNTVTQYMWTSDNIWVRNNNDNGLIHENPDYSALGNPNYVMVRVINKSCVASTGNEQLKLYWAKASTGLSWPSPWTGGVNVPYPNMGNLIGTLTIPIIPAGGETILTFPWQVPNPGNYGNDGHQWHFCLLARIEASTDPMTFPETGDLNGNVRNNNNIAWKNVTVVDVLPDNIENPGGLVAVGNPFNHPKTFFLELEVADLETGKPIYQEAEVGIKMDDVLFNAWERGGKEAQLLDPTAEEKRKIVKGNNVIIDNISFNANEIGTLRLDFNFLTKELTDKTNYAYHVIQKDAETGQVIGGETFIINKNPRPIFEAEAPDKEVDLNQAITISAEDINEPAIYNWYDNEGNLIYQGKDLQVANAVAEKFKLEVIATSDGFKDYKEVEVKLKPNTLENISPNPATNNVLVSYKINGANSAYLMILGSYGTTNSSNNYILDLSSSETNINISNYPNGFYTVSLICNGQIIDAKTLVKQ